MGVALVPTLNGLAARVRVRVHVGRITTPPGSKDYSTWVGCTACVRVCMLFRFSQEVLISTLVIVSYKTMLKKVLQVKLTLSRL